MKTNLFKFLTLSFMVMFQWGVAQKSVSGTVSDNAGVPLPGATVQVVGTNTGVTTDFDGVYSIMASEGDVLSFSYTGFTALTVTVGASATIDVSLTSDSCTGRSGCNCTWYYQRGKISWICSTSSYR